MSRTEKGPRPRRMSKALWDANSDLDRAAVRGVSDAELDRLRAKRDSIEQREQINRTPRRRRSTVFGGRK